MNPGRCTRNTYAHNVDPSICDFFKKNAIPVDNIIFYSHNISKYHGFYFGKVPNHFVLLIALSSSLRFLFFCISMSRYGGHWNTMKRFYVTLSNGTLGLLLHLKQAVMCLKIMS